MDALDLFFKKFSYKFPKGYPDLNNEQDVLLLENILNKLGINIKINELKKLPFDNLGSNAQSVGLKLMKDLNLPKDEIRSDTKNRIVILTDIPRKEIFKKLEDLGYTRNINIPGSSAGGFVTPEGVEIIQKSKSLNAVGGAGIQNENDFVDAINNAINNAGSPITIEIIPSKGDKLTYKNVTKAIHIGKEGEKKGWKGDAQIISNGSPISFSIKKDGPFRWESAMTRYKDLAQTFLTKAYDGKIDKLELKPDPENPKVLQMLNPELNKPYGRIYVTDVPGLNDEESINNIAFGSDKAIILQRTFSENDFKFNESNDTLTITVTKVISSIDDFDENDFPVLEFERNASKATKLEGPFSRGIVLRITPQEKAISPSGKANNLTLSYNDIMS